MVGYMWAMTFHVARRLVRPPSDEEGEKGGFGYWV